MTSSFDRRRFLRSAVALGGLLGGASLPTARAATTGRALVGFQLPQPATTLVETVLAGLRGLYSPDLGSKPVVVPGASSGLAMDVLLKAPADGGTALIAPSGLLTLLPLTRNLDDDPTSHVQPVGGICEICLCFMVGPSVPPSVRTFANYVEWVRLNPNQANYGMPGIGTAPYFVGREMSRSAGVPLKAIAYKGMHALIADIMSGSIPAGVTVAPDADYLASANGVRVLAVSSEKRWVGFPDVPTMVEMNLMQSPATESLGFFFAAGTPEAKVQELAAAIRVVTAQPELQRLMTQLQVRPMPTTSYGTVLANERTTWVQLAKRVDSVGRG